MATSTHQRGGLAYLPEPLLTCIASHLSKPSVGLLAVALTAPSSSWRERNFRGGRSAASLAVLAGAAASIISSPRGGASSGEEEGDAESEGSVAESEEEDAEDDAHQNDGGSDAEDVGHQQPEHPWAVLDFEDVDDVERRWRDQWFPVSSKTKRQRRKLIEGGDTKSLANKLTDDDLGAVLACVDAVSNLKVLRLAGCVNITGIGLEPLRGSTVLEQLDISLVKQNEQPSDFATPPLLSEAHAIPILDSIISADGASLKQLVIGFIWTSSSPSSVRFRGRQRSEEAYNFMLRYNRYLNRHPVGCGACGFRIDNDLPAEHLWGLNVDGVQDTTCYSCAGVFCFGCEGMTRCERCRKFYCGNCATLVACNGCKKDNWMVPMWGGGNFEVHCKDCVSTITCEDCDETKRYCSETIPSQKCNCCGRGGHSDLCQDCSPMDQCRLCEGWACDDCQVFCHRCGMVGCANCVHSKRMTQCNGSNCTKICCEWCTGQNLPGADVVKRCGQCGDELCPKCRREKKGGKGKNACAGCKWMNYCDSSAGARKSR